MPARKTRTTTRQIGHVSVCTQTDSNFYDEKQFDAMTKKIAEYEAKILKLQAENNLLKQRNPKLSKNTTDSGLADNELVENILVKEKSISPDSGNKPTKGCSCKGACANKICGCVKKGISCNKLCKCNNAQCKNQEAEKENATVQSVLSQDGQKVLEKLGRLTLNQEVRHASEKKKKILFSDSKNLLNIEKYAASPVTRRRLFTQDSDDVCDVSVSDKECSSNTEIQFPQTPLAKRNRRLKNKDDQLKIIVTTDEIPTDMQLHSTDDTASTDQIFLPKIAKVIHSPKDKTKLRPLSPEDYVARRKYRGEEADNMKSLEDLNYSGRVNHSPKHQDLENDTTNSLFPVSSNTDNNVLDMSLNPMVPKHQLPRSPVGAAGNIILPNETKRFSPPKKELAVAEVDWEQHQSELIMCNICKRKFFPHRIDKHIASCKGI